jgi:hypothetical protein
VYALPQRCVACALGVVPQPTEVPEPCLRIRGEPVPRVPPRSDREVRQRRGRRPPSPAPPRPLDLKTSHDVSELLALWTLDSRAARPPSGSRVLPALHCQAAGRHPDVQIAAHDARTGRRRRHVLHRRIRPGGIELPPGRVAAQFVPARMRAATAAGRSSGRKWPPSMSSTLMSSACASKPCMLAAVTIGSERPITSRVGTVRRCRA